MHGFAPEVVAITPADFSSPEMVLAMSEPARLAHVEDEAVIDALVTFDLSASDAQRLVSLPANLPAFPLDSHVVFDESDIQRTTLEMADVCVAISGQIMSALFTQSSGG